MQVQPQRQNLKDYLNLGVDFEIMDYAFPTFNKPQITRAYENIKVNSMHAPFVDNNFASNDKAIRSISQRKIKQAIVNGLELGVKNVVVHSAFFPNLSNQALKDIWCEIGAEFLNKIVSQYPVNVFVENTLDFYPDILLNLMEKSQNSHINVCLDVGHAFLSKAPLKDWFKALSPYIKYMHVNDNMGIYDDHLPMGKGKIDWQEVKSLMIKYAPNPTLTVELAGMENIKSGIAYWRELWKA